MPWDIKRSVEHRIDEVSFVHLINRFLLLLLFALSQILAVLIPEHVQFDSKDG